MGLPPFGTTAKFSTSSAPVILSDTKVRLTPTSLADLAIVNIDHFEAERGFFMESWNEKDVDGQWQG